MATPDDWNRIRRWIAQLLGVDETEVDDLLRSDDSLDAVELIMAAEDELGIKISDEDARVVRMMLGEDDSPPPEGGTGVREPRRPSPGGLSDGARPVEPPD